MENSKPSPSKPAPATLDQADNNKDTFSAWAVPTSPAPRAKKKTHSPDGKQPKVPHVLVGADPNLPFQITKVTSIYHHAGENDQDSDSDDEDEDINIEDGCNYTEEMDDEFEEYLNSSTDADDWDDNDDEEFIDEDFNNEEEEFIDEDFNNEEEEFIDEDFNNEEEEFIDEDFNNDEEFDDDEEFDGDMDQNENMPLAK